MPPTIRTNGQIPESNVRMLCQQYVDVEPVLEPHYDRLGVDLAKRVQSRIDANNAPDHMVRRYALLMAEVAFPPPLVTSDGHIVDGNTRFKAHGQRNTRYIECLVLPIAWETATPDIQRKLVLLSLAINTMNGKPLDEVELLKMAAALIQEGDSDEAIVGKTGLTMSKVTSLRDVTKATERLNSLGISPTALGLPTTTLRALGKPMAMSLDDADYTAVADLADKAGLKGNQVNGLATSLKEAGSPESRRERLARERTALEPQVLARAHGQQHPIYTARLRRTLELLREHPVTSFVEGNSEMAAEYIDLLDKAIEKLGELRALQASQPAIAAAATASAEAR
jgi:hypothetical protein